jgi:hypothetical protein
MNRQLDEVLVEALDLFDQGTPVVKILSRYPDLADELRPFLMTARDLNHLAKPGSTAAQEASKKEFLRYATTMQVEQRRSAADRLRDIFVYGLAFLLILFFSGAVMAVSSSSAIPGDALYGTKIFLEQTRLNYSADPAAAAALVEELQKERLDEVKTLLSLGRSETVTFSGEVTELSPERWIVDGIPIVVTSSTILRDDVEGGYLVQVRGMTSDGVVEAEQVDVIAGLSTDPDLNNPDSEEQKNPPTPMPTIEPLKIPERPELILPDGGQRENPTDPTLVPTPIFDDDSTNVDDGGYENENDAQGSQEPEGGEDQHEKDGGSNESINDGNNKSDEHEDGGQNDDKNQDEEKSENSEDVAVGSENEAGNENAEAKEGDGSDTGADVGNQEHSEGEN